MATAPQATAPAPLVVNFVSDLATPLVNELLRAVVRRGVTVHPWYALEKYAGFGFKETFSHDVVEARVFGVRWPSLALLRRAARRGERFVLVGWSNTTTRLLLPLLAATRRSFVFYADHPEPGREGRRVAALVRDRYTALLRAGVVLAVGRNAVAHFVEHGLDPARVRNMPLPVPVRADAAALRARRAEIRATVGAGEGTTLLASGSRMVRSKGFDLAIAAVASLEAPVRARVRVLLIGDGPELPALRAQVAAAGLEDVVRFAPWMEPADFDAHLAAADVVLHPARFDAYGAASLWAVALGVPIVGSRTAGSAVELVEHEHNGLLYEAEDVAALAGHVRHFVEHRGAAAEMGARQAAVAARYTPEKMADVLIDAVREVG